MLHLSEIMIQNPDLDTFEDLLKVVKVHSSNALHFRIDIKPTYPDTPANWEDRLEGAFVGIHSITR